MEANMDPSRYLKKIQVSAALALSLFALLSIGCAQSAKRGELAPRTPEVADLASNTAGPAQPGITVVPAPAAQHGPPGRLALPPPGTINPASPSGTAPNGVSGS